MAFHLSETSKLISSTFTKHFRFPEASCQTEPDWSKLISSLFSTHKQVNGAKREHLANLSLEKICERQA